MLWDTHMHCNFSGDCDADPADMIARAKALGLGGICFTDHLDLDYPVKEDSFDLDLENYYSSMKHIAAAYTDVFEVRRGIEIGLQPHLADTHRDILTKYDFDFVIGSSHTVHGFDPYYDDFFKGKSEREAYTEYFESIIENIAAFDGFDVYGHIDYVVRYGPNKNRLYSYEAYADILDEVLKTLINKGKGIEINTGGFAYGLGHPNPTEDIIKRYRELGGEIITLGADAHKPENIAHSFDKIPGILQAAGFDYFTVFKNRKPEFIRL